ncbi:MAG: hypothetical protein A3G38_04260 [Omnitrophica WOR_2 bacterium RIFCSPLOWO2_12_FULL_51_8]|nr:MAG: hypothetical protein A3G38_04260 [Omnitrophica WOR_2 bacterium RIFCSPLOWO2_12_FULL_51_8]
MESIGARLKKIRLEKGLSLEEAQKKTKIHLNILQAIEGDSITGLNPVYLKGFLKIYCKFLGLEPGDYLPEARARPQPPAAAAKAEAPSAIKLASARPLPDFKKLALIAGLALAVFGLFRLGSFISRRIRLRPAQRPVQRPAVPAAARIQDKRTSGISLTIRARQNCMVMLRADGKLIFHRLLEKGRFENWQAKERFDLFLGNAGGVELEVNGQLFSNLGRKREAKKNIVITKDGLTVR